MTDSELPDAKRQKTGREKGIAVIKPEFRKAETVLETNDTFEEEGRSEETSNKKKDRKRGQNKNRNNAQKHELIRLCPKLIDPENPEKCEHGEHCRYEHDVEKYIAAKAADIDGECPVYKAIGYCPAGVKCRWLGSHASLKNSDKADLNVLESPKELNVVQFDLLSKIQKRQVDMTKADEAIAKMEELDKARTAESKSDLTLEERKEYNASFFEGREKPSEKKRLHLAGAKILSPLTTVGNLPYRRLMKTLGADVTYSEMALCWPLMQGQKSEWALPRMHVSEQVGGFGKGEGHFGVQVAANKPWHAIKAAQLLSEFAGNAKEINLNCGCPIDLIYKQGAGSALMDAPGRAMRIIKGMNAVSGDMPITIKMRTGTKENKATAHSLITKLMDEELVGAITLHGRSRAQRYAREADWGYIKEVAELVRSKREEHDVKPWIIGNGDVYSWEEWYRHIDEHKVDSCMVARGALVKPWIFEEIESKQYLDKSSSQRFEIYKDFAKFGLEHWGSDDFGVQQTRRFMCEFLSFTRRYVPVGILEYLPPQLNERPQPWQGRDELETLFASDHYKDWIKITEMFLGKAPESFVFEPKHKSTS